MADLLLELFCEEIPARMQARAAEDLSALLGKALAEAGLAAQGVRGFYGPRRIGVVATVAVATEAKSEEVRGPLMIAPEVSITAFKSKHADWNFEPRDAKGKQPNELRIFAYRNVPSRPASDVIAGILPALIRTFPWPKSMRWGGTSSMVWVRPLKRILCVLDGAVVPFSLTQGADDGHGLASGDVTEGHRIMSPGAFAVRNFADYKTGLAARLVVLEAEDRARMIRDGITALAAAEGLEVVPDEALITEVAGLVEWPVPLLGRIDDGFMDLPPEVMRTTMRVNQRYFALRKKDGTAAPRFALVSNIAAPDGGAAIIAGNERVLRARLADARFFWDLDQKLVGYPSAPTAPAETEPSIIEGSLGVTLEPATLKASATIKAGLNPEKLNTVVFHAKLGTQGQRIQRLENLTRLIAEKLGANAELARRAAQLAKADLASGMVGEFPELQGVMGRYYALGQGEDERVAEAIAAHYRPLGPADEVPTEPIAVAVALADKIDYIAGFFTVGDFPTGSADPYALRRAALGILRIISQTDAAIDLISLWDEAVAAVMVTTVNGTPVARKTDDAATSKRFSSYFLTARGIGRGDRAHRDMTVGLCQAFLLDRIVQDLRSKGARHDVVSAAIGHIESIEDLPRDLWSLANKQLAVRRFVDSEAGANLLAAHRRAINILRIEEKRDGHAFDTGYEAHLLKLPEEAALAAALEEAGARIRLDIEAEDFERAMEAMVGLRAPVDAFFEKVIVNDPAPELRRNRLRLLARLRTAMDAVADFSKIEA